MAIISGILEKIVDRVSKPTAKSPKGNPFQFYEVNGKGYAWFQGQTGLQVGDNILIETDERGYATSISKNEHSFHPAAPVSVKQTQSNNYEGYDKNAAKWGNSLKVAGTLVAAWAEKTKAGNVEPENLVKLTISIAEELFNSNAPGMNLPPANKPSTDDDLPF